MAAAAARSGLFSTQPLRGRAFTTYARGDELHFANDVYDRDDALVHAAPGAALPLAEWAREASALRAAVSRLVGGL